LHQVGTSSLLIYMMHGHTYIKFERSAFIFLSTSIRIFDSTSYYGKIASFHIPSISLYIVIRSFDATNAFK